MLEPRDSADMVSVHPVRQEVSLNVSLLKNVKEKK